MSKLFNGKFQEMSNLRRKFALSTNFDSWFTSVYLVNKIQFRLKLYFELFDFFVNIRQNLHNWAKAAKESKMH